MKPKRMLPKKPFCGNAIRADVQADAGNKAERNLGCYVITQLSQLRDFPLAAYCRLRRDPQHKLDGNAPCDVIANVKGYALVVTCLGTRIGDRGTARLKGGRPCAVGASRLGTSEIRRVARRADAGLLGASEESRFARLGFAAASP